MGQGLTAATATRPSPSALMAPCQRDSNGGGGGGDHPAAAAGGSHSSSPWLQQEHPAAHEAESHAGSAGPAVHGHPQHQSSHEPQHQSSHEPHPHTHHHHRHRHRHGQGHEASRARLLGKPAFHILPPQGWINDPNGPLFYNGLYHM